MSVLTGAFVPPEGIDVGCGQAPELWCAEPIRLASGAGQRSGDQRIAADNWDKVSLTCARCPLFYGCQEYGLQHPDEPMVYGGMSQYMRQIAVRGYVKFGGRRSFPHNRVAVLLPEHLAPDGTPPVKIPRMRSPHRCTACRNVHDRGLVEVVARYADCSVWKCPACGVRQDDRKGW